MFSKRGAARRQEAERSRSLFGIGVFSSFSSPLLALQAAPTLRRARGIVIIPFITLNNFLNSKTFALSDESN